MRVVRFLTLLLLLTVAGCGSSPNVNYYTLDSVQRPIGSSAPVAVLGIGPIAFPEYLKRPQIVTRTGANALDVDEFNRWGEPLDSAFTRTLIADVGGQLNDVTVMGFPFGGGLIEVDYRLLGEVLRFDVDQSGTAVLDVSWGLVRADGARLAEPRRVQYTAEGARGGGYDSVVDAMNEALEDFSRDIVRVFRTSGG